jgi:hypothetical protein
MRTAALSSSADARRCFHALASLSLTGGTVTTNSVPPPSVLWTSSDAAERRDHAGHEPQPEPDAAETLARRRIGLPEPFQHFVDLVRPHADPGVAHPDLERPVRVQAASTRTCPLGELEPFRTRMSTIFASFSSSVANRQARKSPISSCTPFPANAGP